MQEAVDVPQIDEGAIVDDVANSSPYPDQESTFGVLAGAAIAKFCGLTPRNLGNLYLRGGYGTCPADAIHLLNDNFRATFIGGHVV
jgi:hypothetical protein